MPVPTLYHGTDARILRMSPAEINSFKQDILKALDYMWPFFEPYTQEHRHQEYKPSIKGTVSVQDVEYLKELLDYAKDSTLYCQVSMAININQMRLSNRKQWQYDGLYLTNWDWQAMGYAKRGFAFGELGLVASILITAAKKIKFKGWNPGPDTERAMTRIHAFSEDKPEPVVVVLDNLDITHIKDEGGEPLKEGFTSRVFMYDGEINLNDYPILESEPSGNSMTEMLEYRNGTLTQQKW